MQITLTNSLRIGVLFALLAAFLNSTSGIWILFAEKWKKQYWNWTHLAKISLCAFFGIGSAYIFEIMAYRSLSAPVVVLCLMGTSTITTLFIDPYWLKPRKT